MLTVTCDHMWRWDSEIWCGQGMLTDMVWRCRCPCPVGAGDWWRGGNRAKNGAMYHMAGGFHWGEVPFASIYCECDDLLQIPVGPSQFGC